MRTLLLFPVLAAAVVGCRDAEKPVATTVPVTAGLTQRVDAISPQTPPRQSFTNGQWAVTGTDFTIAFSKDGTARVARVTAGIRTAMGTWRPASPDGIVLSFPGAFSGSVTDAYFHMSQANRSLRPLGHVTFDVEKFTE